ncbi:MAG: flagellin, partial [Paracoccaceae bacterium]
ALTVATNTGALMAQAAASSVNKEMEISMERLASGKRINGASDDAAGVAIASRLTSEIKGTNQAIRNAMDGQAMIDTAEGAHQEVESILQRMRELAVQASNDSNSDADRTALQSEVTALVSEIDRIANVSTWAGKGLIDQGRSFTFNVGSHGGGHNEIVATTTAMTGAALGVSAGNATVGVNGATLTEVGESVLQVGGTPVAGDTYKYTINGTDFQVQLVADGSNFDYKVSTDGGATFGAAVTSHSQSNGATAAGVADIIAHQVNALTDHPGLTATANSDGSVTVAQSLNLTGSRTEISTTASADLAGAVLTTTGTKTINSVTVPDGNIVEFDITGFTHGTSTITLTINGSETIYTPDSGSADEYEDSAAGIAAGLQAALDANANMKGVSWQVDVNSGKVRVGYTQDSAALITDEAATAAQSTTALLINTQSDASAAIATIDAAIVKVNSQRASLGAISNRLDSTVNNLTSISSNLAAGRGRIEDADFAAETTSLAKSQILQQASTAMLAQANASKQNVLSLLQG